MADMCISRNFRAAALSIVLAPIIFQAGECRADRISLRGGGQIRGKVIPDTAHPGRVIVLTETGKTPLNFQKAQILEVTNEPSVLDEYVIKKAKAEPTAQGQYDLGRWCKEHKLADLATVHYEAAVAQDKSFGPAHQALGHVPFGDRWLNADEVREAQGLVRYKGKWISKEEKDHREALVAASAVQNSWVRRIRILRQAIASGASDRGREAEQQLMEIRDPVAVKPLIRVLGEDEDSFRMLLDHVLGVIPGPEAAAGLVSRILAEPDSEVRHTTLTELERRQEENVIPGLVRALQSTSPEVVNRAAWALSNLNAVSAAPKLIPALITTRYEVVFVPSSGGPGTGLGSIDPSQRSGVPIYTNGSSIGLLTPPAVGPGVVAYGATQVPWVSSGFSLSAGGGGFSGSRGPEAKVATFTFRNVEVLAALVRLTGQDFGYDIATWKRWAATSFQPDRAPVRKVPQP